MQLIIFFRTPTFCKLNIGGKDLLTRIQAIQTNANSWSDKNMDEIYFYLIKNIISLIPNTIFAFDKYINNLSTLVASSSPYKLCGSQVGFLGYFTTNSQLPYKGMVFI